MRLASLQTISWTLFSVLFFHQVDQTEQLGMPSSKYFLEKDYVKVGKLCEHTP